MSILKSIKKDRADGDFAEQRRLILGPNSNFYIQEAYNTLRTNIRFAVPGDGCKRICLTSSLSGEGKSTTVLNLAISFSETGNRILLIDADMRRPSQSRLLIEKTSPGLSAILAGICKPQDAIRKDIRPNLDVIFAGELPPNPLELLGNERMGQMIEELSALYDVILVDTPPVGVVSDACEVARVTDGVLMLVHQNRTVRDSVIRSLKQLSMSNARLLGFVMNGIGDAGSKSYKYRYKYRGEYSYTDHYSQYGKYGRND